MPKVRFVEGKPNDYVIRYDTEWPIVPRVGEFLSIETGTAQQTDWEVVQVRHLAAGDESLIGTLVFIEERKPRSYDLGTV